MNKTQTASNHRNLNSIGKSPFGYNVLKGQHQTPKNTTLIGQGNFRTAPYPSANAY
jgi:hypothetical protein